MMQDAMSYAPNRMDIYSENQTVIHILQKQMKKMIS